jgi:hypothetical protein
MSFSSLPIIFLLFTLSLPALGQAPAESSSSSSAKHLKKPAAEVNSEIDPGTVSGSVYRNKILALSFKIPTGWVLRTEEMNAPRGASGDHGTDARSASPSPDSRGDCPHMCSRVLLAAFSRPPEARGEDVNASILIAVESQAAYPGLKDAAQYFGPLTEVAKAQGFAMDEEPYEIALENKILVRADFHRDVGTRVMRQSTLVFLSQGYAVSITVIGGTEDAVEELIDGLSFAGK